ncbi:Cysteine desulfuration protein SufE [Thiorhodovibrio winogradskyi]|uniref:Cysteine desulfuration protein SufE n=1 Tax=Thiorhodovibrio winogradskyi TaxID=77007 RepID=A0ABZ0SGT1_9GAMM|nr:SufE family protein [Thiorhodovibrio winogradskyi]
MSSPPAAASSASSPASEQIAEIIDTFELLGDWDQRYQYLVEIGEKLAPMEPADKSDANQVKECMSTVHVVAKADAAGNGQLQYQGDCDTSIIKGVVALLVGLFSGKTPTEIEALDVDALFEGLRLEDHLSPSRHVGVYAIVNKMKGQALAFS